MNKTVLPFEFSLKRKNFEKIRGSKSFCVWFFGLSGSGKSTLANELQKAMFQLGIYPALLDGDTLRSGLNKDLNFSNIDRDENIRRTIEISKLFIDTGVPVINSLITPSSHHRKEIIREMKEDVKLIWVSTPLSICQSRDTKGLYKKAVEGEISNFTGINAQFEVPEEECLVVNAGEESIENCLKKILIYISEFLVPIK